MAKKLQSCRCRFLDRSNWFVSKSNPRNLWRWIDFPDGSVDRLTVYEDGGVFGLYLHGFDHWNKYRSQEAAQEGAFDWLEELFANAEV